MAAAALGTASAAAAASVLRRRRRRTRGPATARQALPSDAAYNMCKIDSDPTAEDASSVQLWKASDLIEEVRDLLEGRIPDELIHGVECGWPGYHGALGIDDIYRPVPGELTVVTGRPGSGKTEWLLSAVTHIAETEDWRVALCCFETESHNLLTQMLEKRHRKNWTNLSPEGMDIEWIEDHFPTICTPYTEISIEEILRNAQWVHDRTPLKGLIIDPYNYIAFNSDQAKTNSETELVSIMLTKVKQFAERNLIHVWLVAHPGKQGNWTGKRPQLYDCSGSAHFYNKCDMGLVLDRDREDFSLLHVYCDKVRNREAGQPGMATLEFCRENRTYRGTETPEHIFRGKKKSTKAKKTPTTAQEGAGRAGGSPRHHREWSPKRECQTARR